MSFTISVICKQKNEDIIRIRLITPICFIPNVTQKVVFGRRQSTGLKSSQITNIDPFATAGAFTLAQIQFLNHVRYSKTSLLEEGHLSVGSGVFDFGGSGTFRPSGRLENILSIGILFKVPEDLFGTSDDRLRESC